MLELARSAIYHASDLVRGWWTIALPLGTGLFLTIRFRFAQIACLPRAFALMRRRGPSAAEGALSPFQASRPTLQPVAAPASR